MRLVVCRISRLLHRTCHGLARLISSMLEEGAWKGGESFYRAGDKWLTCGRGLIRCLLIGPWGALHSVSSHLVPLPRYVFTVIHTETSERCAGVSLGAQSEVDRGDGVWWNEFWNERQFDRAKEGSCDDILLGFNLTTDYPALNCCPVPASRVNSTDRKS